MDDNAQPADAPASLRQHLRPDLFRALCDPTRLQVLGRLALAKGPQTVTEVAGCCGVHLSGVSRHLACLREVGVVEAVKEGREVRYSLRREELTHALRSLADAIDGCGRDCIEDMASKGDACCEARVETKDQEEDAR